MPKLVYGKGPYSEWIPPDNVITLSDSEVYKEKLPSLAAHEIAHWKLEHGGGSSSIGQLVEERDAWVEAIRRMPPDEVDLDFINTSFGSYVREIRDEYGEGSPQYREAKVMRHNLMGLARDKVRYGIRKA